MDCPCDRAFVLVVADVGDGPGLAYSYRLSELGDMAMSMTLF